MTRNDTKQKRPRTHAEINDFRRKALIEGAIRSLSAHGVAGTTVRTICREANVSRGLIGHYFQSKDQLLEAAFRHLFSLVADFVAGFEARAEPSPFDRLMAVPKALLSTAIFTETNRDAFLTFWHEMRFNDLIRNAHREAYSDYRKRIEHLFEQAAVQLDHPIDSQLAAVGLITMLDGMWLDAALDRQFASRRTLVRTCQNYIRTQFGLGLET